MIKNIVKQLVESGYKAKQIGYNENVDQAIYEMLYAAFIDEIYEGMENAEKKELDAQRGKPKTRAEWHEYIGADND
jgi:hypothetical protein